jgi:protocatechuate 3,4-dioxygenase beta subunit
VFGAVLDRDGRPVAGARVFALDLKTGTAGQGQIRIAGSDKAEAEAETEPSGAFRLDGLGPGYFQVMATSAEQGEALVMGIEGGRRDVFLRLGGIAGLRGKVIDAGDGTPVAGARVRESLSGRTTTAGDDGSFELKVPLQPDRDAEDTFFLRADHLDYDPWWDRVQAGDEPVEIRLKHGAGIAGTVVDGKGKPVAGARISIEVPGIPQAFLLLNRQGPGLTTFSEPDGSFFLPSVLPSAPGVGAPGVELVAWRPGVGRGRTTVPPAGGDAQKEVQIILRPASTLVGRVTDAAGGPVEGALIRLFQETKAVGELKMMLELLPVARGHAGYSDRTGWYRIGDLDPGSYRLEALAFGLARNVMASVVVGEEETRLDVALEPGGTVSGRVVDPAGDPIAGVEVVAFPAGDGNQPKVEGRPDPQEMMAREFRKVAGIGVANARTGQDGTFRIEHLSEGEFRIMARAPGHPVVEGGPVRCGETLPDLVLAAYGKITGRAVASDGTAIREFDVALTGSAPPGPFTTNRWGSLRFVHPEGKFLVEDLDAGEYGLTITATDYLPFRKKVRIEPGQEEVVEAVLEDGASVEGAVRSAEDDQPIAGVKIYVNRENAKDEEWLHKEAWSDEAGKFGVRGLPEGKYSVSSWHPDYYGDGDQRAEFSVPFTEPLALGLRLRQGGKVLGRIEGLKPVESREVSHQVVLSRIAGEKDAETSAEKAGEQPDQVGGGTWIGVRGTFEVVSLQPGTYRVALQRFSDRQGQRNLADGPPQVLGEVEVRPGETSEFRAAVK